MPHLLVLQSKRILIASTANKLRSTGNDRLRRRLADLQLSADRALTDYRKAVLAWASPATPKNCWPT